jgi:hypothetical protein
VPSICAVRLNWPLTTAVRPPRSVLTMCGPIWCTSSEATCRSGRWKVVSFVSYLDEQGYELGGIDATWDTS